MKTNTTMPVNPLAQIGLHMVTTIALMCASGTGCTAAGEDVQDQSAVADITSTPNPFNSAFTMTVHCGLVSIGVTSSDGANTGCGQGEVGTAAFLAGSDLTATTEADTIDCRDWKAWTGACAGQGRRCILRNVNSDVVIGVKEGPLFGCTPR